MGLNVVQDTIASYLADLAAGHEREEMAALLSCALLRPLSKELSRQTSPDNLKPLEEIPQAAPGWLRQAFNQGQPLHAFAPDPRMQDDLRHIADWIAAALANDEDWLKDCDEQGRPKKLVKIGSLAQAKFEADKAMLLFAQKAAAQPYDEAGNQRTVMVFDNGYRIVQLLTPEALDRESAFLGHCVGKGAYDDKLKKGTHAFYSLRDARGKGHATMDVKIADNDLLQCKGKQNKPPVSKYMPYIQAFVKERRFRLTESPRMTGLIEQDGEYYDIANLPRNFHFRGGLDLSDCTGLTALPDNLSVGVNLVLTGCTGLTALPDGLHVGRSLDLSDCTGLTALPDGLHVVGGSLNLRSTGLTALPDNIHVGADLNLRDTGITALPDGLRVGGNLNLTCCTGLTALPDGLRVGGGFNLSGCTGLTALPDGLHVVGGLNLRGCTGLTALPDGLHVSGNLDLYGCTGITALPDGLRVGGSLNLRGCTGITALPDGLRVGTDLDLNETGLTALPDGLHVGVGILLDSRYMVITYARAHLAQKYPALHPAGTSPPARLAL